MTRHLECVIPLRKTNPWGGNELEIAHTAISKLTFEFAEDKQTTTVEADTVSDAVFFTELDEEGWHDPAEIPIKSNPDLFAHE